MVNSCAFHQIHFCTNILTPQKRILKFSGENLVAKNSTNGDGRGMEAERAERHSMSGVILAYCNIACKKWSIWNTGIPKIELNRMELKRYVMKMSSGLHITTKFTWQHRMRWWWGWCWTSTSSWTGASSGTVTEWKSSNLRSTKVVAASKTKHGILCTFDLNFNVQNVILINFFCAYIIYRQSSIFSIFLLKPF